MPCIDLAMPPDHNMVLNEAVEVPSWMSASFGQVMLTKRLRALPLGGVQHDNARVRLASFPPLPRSPGVSCRVYNFEAFEGACGVSVEYRHRVVFVHGGAGIFGISPCQ